MGSHGALVGSQEAFSHTERWKVNVGAPVWSPRLQHQELARHPRALAVVIPTQKDHKKKAPMDIDISLTGS